MADKMTKYLYEHIYEIGEKWSFEDRKRFTNPDILEICYLFIYFHMQICQKIYINPSIDFFCIVSV